LVLYSVLRFSIDFIRSYEPSAFPVASVPLTLNQWTSIGVFVFAAARLARLRRSEAPAQA
jgi:prolipoprotein diacylglyceryltransferase